MGTRPAGSPTALGLVLAFLRLPLIAQIPESPSRRRLTLGWALTAWIGLWLSLYVVSDELQRGWQLGSLISGMITLVGLTLVSNYQHSRR